MDNSDIKYSFCNLSENTSLEVLARNQSLRYWIERALEDSKGLTGLDEYQIVGWRGWHHHMAMSFLATLFLLYLRQELVSKAPMFTLQDAKQVLEVLIPKKILTLKDIVDVIKQKHLKRAKDRACKLGKAERVALSALQVKLT